MADADSEGAIVQILSNVLARGVVLIPVDNDSRFGGRLYRIGLINIWWLDAVRRYLADAVRERPASSRATGNNAIREQPTERSHEGVIRPCDFE
jgi:hypothetical protein